MNTKLFYKNIEDTTQPTEEKETNAFEKLILHYPYFQSAHMLLTIDYHKNENIAYTKQLKKTAAIVSCRKKLKQHLLIEKSEIKNKTTSKINQKNSTDLNTSIINHAIDASIQKEVSSINSDQNNKENSIENPIEFQHGLYNINKLNENPSHYSTIDTKGENKTQEIIDKFIKNSPGISTPKKELFTPSKMAQQSIEENEQIITPTLAKIYAQQGNINKAIEAYNRLSLIYPEKNTYFAAEIKKLEQQLK